MTPPKPITEFDHPEHCWKWTETELRWITKRDQQWSALLAEKEALLTQALEMLEFYRRMAFLEAGARVGLCDDAIAAIKRHKGMT